MMTHKPSLLMLWDLVSDSQRLNSSSTSTALLGKVYTAVISILVLWISLRSEYITYLSFLQVATCALLLPITIYLTIVWRVYEGEVAQRIQESTKAISISSKTTMAPAATTPQSSVSKRSRRSSCKSTTQSLNIESPSSMPSEVSAVTKSSIGTGLVHRVADEIKRATHITHDKSCPFSSPRRAHTDSSLLKSGLSLGSFSRSSSISSTGSFCRKSITSSASASTKTSIADAPSVSLKKPSKLKKFFSKDLRRRSF